MKRPSVATFRRATVLFAALLGIQALWILAAEFYRLPINRLPVDEPAAAAAGQMGSNAAEAASIGIIRGDLWAEAAYTYADLLWVQPSADRSLTPVVERAHTLLDHALDYAPHDSGSWLLLGGLASRYPMANINATEALKMSYFTGPSELELAPLRLRIATHLEVLGDADLQQLIARDIKILFTKDQKAAVVQAYGSASAAGRRFIETTIAQIDPSASRLLH